MIHESMKLAEFLRKELDDSSKWPNARFVDMLERRLWRLEKEIAKIKKAAPFIEESHVSYSTATKVDRFRPKQVSQESFVCMVYDGPLPDGDVVICGDTRGGLYEIKPIWEIDGPPVF